MKPTWIDDDEVLKALGMEGDTSFSEGDDEEYEEDDVNPDVPPPPAKFVILDRGVESEVAYGLLESVNDLGYTPEQAIAGLIHAVVLLAQQTGDPEECVNECADLLDELNLLMETEDGTR